MKTVWGRTGWYAGLALSTLLTAPALAAQTTTMPSTLNRAATMTQTSVIGINTFHPSRMIWS